MMQQTLVKPDSELGREGALYLRQLRFPPQLEHGFQAAYYARVRPTLRMCIILLAVASLLSLGIHHIAHKSSLKPDVARLYTSFAWGAAAINLLLVGASFHRKFGEVWQPWVVMTTLLSLLPHLFEIEDKAAVPLIFSYLFIVLCRFQRLQFRWLVLLLVALILPSFFSSQMQSNPSAPQFWLSMGLLAAALIVPLVFSWRSERFERSEFWTKHVLAQERNAERQKREQSEQMLHVLSQAIGGIVHDLGNPLTSVQTGAETLLYFVKTGDPDKETIQEFAEIITDGAQMLNYLRLSLMEQTRVLEGKPIPVEVKPVPLRQLVQSGAHYQKPKFSSGRNVTLMGDELEVCVDEMRFVTIFMNLIGNALKYSDGEVRIAWRAHEGQALIAVLDRGRGGQGITQAQAEKLFVAFGRLDTHAQVEGTGLGLLSVRKIAEAHQGEVYIEGYHEGVANSQTFTTAHGKYPPLLETGFHTAFVTVCPLHQGSVLPQERSTPIQNTAAAATV